MEKDTFDQLVHKERLRQDEKWGEQNHTPELWYLILSEEYGELGTAVLLSIVHPDKQRGVELEDELIQVAAVCKVMWESGKRNGWI